MGFLGLQEDLGDGVAFNLAMACLVASDRGLLGVVLPEAMNI